LPGKRALAQENPVEAGLEHERRYEMKLSANIMYLTLSLILFCLIGCNRGYRSRRVAPAEQIRAEQFSALDDSQFAAAIQLSPVADSAAQSPAAAQSFAEAQAAVLSHAEPVKIVVGESGQRTISRIYPCPESGNVRLDKVMPGQVVVNQPFTYLLKVTNLTGATLSPVVVTEELPENFELSGAEPTAKQDGKILVWEIDSLAPRAVVEIKVSGVASKTESLKYCTNVVTPVDTTCASVQVIQPRLKLTKIAPEGVLLCDPIHVKFVVANTGTGVAKDVKIVDTLPEGLLTVDGKNELVISVGTLAAGQTKEFFAEFKASKPAKYVSKAVAISSDGQRVESEPVATVVDQPVLTITQSGPEKVYVGRSLTYEITVTNESDAPAKNVVIENDIPASVTSMKATAGAKLTGKKIVWPLGTLGPKASRTVHISFSPTKKGTITNNVRATAQCTEIMTASVQTVVRAIPAVLLEVIDVLDPVEVGGRTTYVIVVTNQGSAPSTNVSIVCGLEGNVRYVSSSGATNGSLENGTLAFAPLSRLAPKTKATWRVVITAVKPGDTRFKVTMNADELSRPVEETEATRVYE